jgi:hypothetical protein
MDYVPYYNFYDYYSRQVTGSSYIRVLHSSPDAPAVDVYTNGNLIARGLSYRQFTPYLPVPPGNYQVEVFRAGTNQNPLVSTAVTVPSRSIATVAATGMLNDLSLFTVPDLPTAKQPGKVNIRFVHLSPNTPRVDITLPNGTKIFSNVGYRETTPYLPVDPGNYTLEARLAGTSQVALYVPNINLRPDRFYTVYAIGLSSGNPPLQVLIPLDGNSYLQV